MSYVEWKVKSCTCYSTSYMKRTHGQKCFTILEVAADWNELMISQHTMQPSIASVNEQLDPWFAASKHITAPISHTRTSPWARKLIVISHRRRVGGWVGLSTQSISKLLKVACKWPAVRIEPQPESYKSTLTTRSVAHIHSQVHLPRVVTW